MITALINTTKYQKGDFSKHKNFNPLIHKVFNTVTEFKNSEYYKINLFTPFSDNEITKLTSNINSYNNNDNNWK